MFKYPPHPFHIVTGDTSLSIPDMKDYENLLTHKPVLSSTNVIKVSTGNTVNSYEWVAYTAEEKELAIQKIKMALCLDLSRQGIPSQHFPSTTKFVYRGDHYVINLDILASLDVFRYPPNKERYLEEHQSHPFYFHTEMLTLPAMVDDKLTKLRLRGNAATELIFKFYNVLKDYGTTLMMLYDSIVDLKFDSSQTLASVWKNLYGVNIGEPTEYVYLK